MKRIGGLRRKSRHKMKKTLSDKGKIHIRKYLQEFDNGDKVVLKAYPSHQGGLFPLRFFGKVGQVTGKQGDCFKVAVKDGGKVKSCVIHPVHLVRV